MNGSPCVSPSSSKLDFNKRDQRHCWSRFGFVGEVSCLEFKPEIRYGRGDAI